MNHLGHADHISSRHINVAASSAEGDASFEMRRRVRAIFWAGTICGVMDITAAFVTWGVQGVSPLRLLQAIASGLLGMESYRGGWQTGLLGGICHFFIAYSAAAVFYVASRRLKFLTERVILYGAMYGVFVYAFMNWIVIPLSRLHPLPFSFVRMTIAVLTHIVCVGLPIALSVKHFSK
jgi:uncharacterized membrane protein YagU involved in acid resistance